MSKEFEHVLKSGKKIRIYDGLFETQVRHRMYDMLSRASYKIGWEDTNAIETNNYKYLHHIHTDEELAKLGLIMQLAPTPLFKSITGRDIDLAVTNLSTSSDIYFPHTHMGQDVILYYANLNWERHWFGETLFYDEELENIELCLPYKPGRVVFFDGGIPHSIRPQSSAAPSYRFTVSVFLKDRPPAD